MLTPTLAVVGGLLLLIWSADRFVDGATATSRHLGVPPLLIGMVVVGFGTSAPEMVVSAISALKGNPGLALGNAYGSNIANIGLILGLTSLISPIAVSSRVLRKELPQLTLATVFAITLLIDGDLKRIDGILLLTFFSAFMTWTIWKGLRQRVHTADTDIADPAADEGMGLQRGIMWLLVGLTILAVSSKILVWGAVEIAHFYQVSDMIIGLTIVALGTSLPELAASLTAIRRGEHDLAIGNVIGSNLFNTLAVVGIASTIHPLPVSLDVITRDGLLMTAMTLALFVFGYSFHGPGKGRINRFEGAILLVIYLVYVIWLATTVSGAG